MLRRDRSIARAWACSRVSGVVWPVSSSPGLAVPGAGDPHVLEDVFEVGVGQVDVVFGHAVGDLAEVAADVAEAGTGPQQVGGHGVPGLVRHVLAEVEGLDPGPESAVEPLVGQRDGAVGVAVGGGEQGEPGALRAGRSAAVPGGEQVEGLALPLGEDVV